MRLRVSLWSLQIKFKVVTSSGRPSTGCCDCFVHGLVGACLPHGVMPARKEHPGAPLGGDVCVLTLLSLKDGECFAQMVSMWGECAVSNLIKVQVSRNEKRV